MTNSDFVESSGLHSMSEATRMASLIPSRILARMSKGVGCVGFVVVVIFLINRNKGLQCFVLLLVPSVLRVFSVCILSLGHQRVGISCSGQPLL